MSAISCRVPKREGSAVAADTLQVVDHLEPVPADGRGVQLLAVKLPADVMLLGRLHQMMRERHPGYTAGGRADGCYVFYAPAAGGHR